jgi:pimeloyl-ACP methyl ester carboxylesterase
MSPRNPHRTWRELRRAILDHTEETTSTNPMKTRTLAFLALAAIASAAQAQDCPDTSAYGPAREIIADLHRIESPDGVQEHYAARIGGIDQWVTVRGQDRANPMILFVHGGPATPLTPGLWQFQRPLEEYFTLATYDQRGAGKTFATVDHEGLGDTVRIDRYVDDLIEVAEHLRGRHGKDKLVLMAHSWGTIPSMQAALRRPDLFHAYVGIGQVIDVRENERVSFDYARAQARAHGNDRALAELASIAPYPGDQPITRERIVLARKWAQHYGGMTAYRDASALYYYRAPRLSPLYDDAARCAVNAGNVFTLGRILPEFLEVDFQPVDEFPIPVLMFMGRHDYTTPSDPTAAWLSRVEAPYKRGVWFEHASHMIPWEEPGKLLVSLIEHVRPLASGGQR